MSLGEVKGGQGHHWLKNDHLYEGDKARVISSGFGKVKRMRSVWISSTAQTRSQAQERMTFEEGSDSTEWPAAEELGEGKESLEISISSLGQTLRIYIEK